jgi:hypothetical protein
MMRSILSAALLLTFVSLADAQSKVSTFPQVADGAFSDGSYYKTTFMILPALSFSSSITCMLSLHGLGVNLDNQGAQQVRMITIAQGSYYASATAADQPIKTGYASLTCSDFVYTQALYSYYAKDGTKAGEATVFGADGDFGGSVSYRMIADQRNGLQLGIAIANDTDSSHIYNLTINSLSATVTVPGRSSLARFLSEILPTTANTIGVLTIQSADSTDFYAIGLRFSGTTFTTIPAN